MFLTVPGTSLSVQVEFLYVGYRPFKAVDTKNIAAYQRDLKNICVTPFTSSVPLLKESFHARGDDAVLLPRGAVPPLLSFE